MNSNNRIMAALSGEKVDRQPVCFYEIDGYKQSSDDESPYNIYNDPSWLPLLELAKEKSDSIANLYPPVSGDSNCDDPMKDKITVDKFEEGQFLFTKTTINANGRKLTSTTKIDKDINTVWTTEHLLKNTDDLLAYLDLPEPVFSGTIDTGSFIKNEKKIGDGGIAMINTGDPICMAAPLFSMEEYTIIAMTEQKLFHRLLERFAKFLYPKTEAAAKALPGRLWRICGPEYASEPYLPPSLFNEYVTHYITPMINSIKKHNGYPRIHSHGRLKNILGEIKKTGCVGLDPIEPCPQGDVSLREVRDYFGEDFTLFGNLEASDLENLPTDKFAEKIKVALKEGPNKNGSHFVLMPSACPYGRKLSDRTMANYLKMIEVAENFNS